MQRIDLYSNRLVIVARAVDRGRLPQRRRQRQALVAADPHDGVPPWECDLTAPSVLALGAERDGIGPAITHVGSLPVVRVAIPQAPGSESLNVAAAGAALMAEALRQRSSVA